MSVLCCAFFTALLRDYIREPEQWTVAVYSGTLAITALSFALL